MGTSEHHHPPLKLPDPGLRVRGREVYDSLRSKWVVLTPEEWVRQHVIGYLVNHLNVPRGLIRVEGGHVRDGMARRCDVAVSDRQGRSWMLVECKAYGVKVGQGTLDQVARYAATLDPVHVMVTNGMTLFAASRESGEGYRFVERLPIFPDA